MKYLIENFILPICNTILDVFNTQIVPQLVWFFKWKNSVAYYCNVFKMFKLMKIWVYVARVLNLHFEFE